MSEIEWFIDSFINDLLILRFYELKKKFRYLIHKNSQKNTVRRDLSSCIMKKFSGHQIVGSLRETTLKLEFKSIDIFCGPVKYFKRKNNHFFTDKRAFGLQDNNF